MAINNKYWKKIEQSEQIFKIFLQKNFNLYINFSKEFNI